MNRGEGLVIREFKSIEGIDLIVKSRKSAVFFEVEGQQIYGCSFEFSPKVFAELVEYLQAVATVAWENFVPKEADSLASDYFEYYDKEFDNNGYIAYRNRWIHLERPSLESPRFYKFNKRKMESFLFDLKKYKEAPQ